MIYNHINEWLNTGIYENSRWKEKRNNEWYKTQPKHQTEWKQIVTEMYVNNNVLSVFTIISI